MSKDDIIEKITNFVINTYNDYVLFISLINNEENDIISKKDSIEFLIITENISYERNQEIMKYIRGNFNDCKINVTFTSKKETMNYNCLNDKAMQGLFFVQKGITKSLYHNSSFTYFIDENMIKNKSSNLCLNKLSKIISLVSDFDNLADKENEQYKLLNLVYYAVKEYFIIKDIFPQNINQCLKILSELSSINLDFDIERVLRKEINQNEDFEKLKIYCFKVAEFLLERLNERNYVQTTSQDIRVKANDVTYKVRAGGLIEFNDKYLFVKMGLGSYWCVPGGHLEWFENSENAVIREVEEETEMPVEIKNLFLLHENFYLNVKNQKFHEMCFYYLLKPKDEQKIIKDQIKEEFDKDKKDVLEFRWFTKDEIEKLEIKPTIIKEIIMNNKTNQMNHEIKKNLND